MAGARGAKSEAVENEERARDNGHGGSPVGAKDILEEGLHALLPWMMVTVISVAATAQFTARCARDAVGTRYRFHGADSTAGS